MMSSCRMLSLVAIWVAFFVLRSCHPADPQVSKPVVLPETIRMGLATELIVTSKITTKTTGPKQTPTDVKLLRVSSSNVVTSDLGTMLDDGANGDAIAGDQVFTLKLMVTEPAPGEMRLIVGASFPALQKQIRSPVSAVPIVSANAAPVVSAGTDQTILLTAIASLSGTANDDGLPSGSRLTALWSKVNGPGTVTFGDAGAIVTTASFSTVGNYQLKLSASDSELTSTDEVNIIVNSANQPPTVSITNPVSNTVLTAPASITFAASANDDDGSVTKVEFFEGNTKLGEATTAPHGLIWNKVAEGNYSLTARATDDKNSTTTSNAVNIIVKASSTLPPDPVSVAPPLDLSIATDIKTSTEFLYTGANRIQTGVTPGTIEARRVGVLRGKVLDRSNASLTGVKISVLGHPEFGQTLTRADGAFDIAVNGGGPITVQYDKAGYLSAQRQVLASWRDYSHLDDVLLIPRDAEVTTINLGATTASMQVARSSVQTDADGTRRATVLFPAGTTAGLVQPDGTTIPASALNMRLTEYTVGPNGRQAMPAELPPTSAYTYAVELGADEAVTKANGRDVVFNQPVFFYVENFLNIPVGEIVPVGYYDNTRSVWVASNNGRVLKVLSITGGLADVDVDGDEMADTGVSLTALDVTDAERQQLASLYAAGTSLWRAPLMHLSTWDFNWPYYGCTTTDCDQPNPGDPTSDDPPDVPCRKSGSVIECESQVLGEAVSITATPFTLNYRSNRAPGRSAAYFLRIPLSGATVHAKLMRIKLVVNVAGRQFVQTFPAAPNQRTSFTWDGKDAYGRRVNGQRPVEVRVGYIYPAVLLTPANYPQSFAFLGLPEERLSPSRMEITLWKDWRSFLGAWDARAQGLGGWTLDVHHAYDPAGGALLLGEGSRRTTQSLPNILSRVTSGSFCGVGPCGDGGPAILAGLAVAQNLAVGPDGSIYIPSREGQRVRRVGPDGIITTVAGTGARGFSGDHGPATQAQLSGPEGVAVGPDGSLYIADTGNHRIRRVGLDGLISTVAGNGSDGGGGGINRADGPATDVAVFAPTWISVAPDGGLYISDQSIVRRVGTDGAITTFTGSTGGRCTRGPGQSCGDGGPAARATFYSAAGLAATPDGAVYIADQNEHSVRRVGSDGIITTVAGGTSTPGYSGDGGPATQALLNQPSNVSAGPDGSVYISDPGNGRIRRVSTEGVISTVIGGGPPCRACGYGGPATQAWLGGRLSAHVAPDGALIVWDGGNSGVVRVAPLLGGVIVGNHVIAAEDGSEVYLFSNSGRHLRTIHALTGAVLYQFTYDIAGWLATVTDGDNNVTKIERTVLGVPTAIVSPFGQRNTLTVDPNGYLVRIANPAGESFQLETTASGLLTKFTDPKGNSSQITYDELGRLTRDTNAAGGFTGLARTDTEESFTASISTALGRTTRYQLEHMPTGGQRRLNQFPDGTRIEVLIGTDASRKTTFADGTITNLLEGPDSRFSMQAPLARSLSTTTGGLTSILTTTRTASLADPNNSLSLTKLTDTATLNGRIFTSVYDAATRTATSTSAEGRQSNAVIDSLGRVVKSQITGLLAYNLAYDPRGRLARITQGTGVDERKATLSYNTDGYLDTLTDPLGRTLRFAYDGAGRVTRQTLPDGRAIVYGYDVNGNLTSLTPPGRLAHLFSYTSLDLQGEYTPPNVGAGSNSTRYTYNLDKQLTRVARPDDQILDFGYDSAGRPSTLTLPTGQISYAYDTTTGKVTGVTAPDGGTLSFTYNGALLTQTAWTGTVEGNLSRAYDNDFRVKLLSVNGKDAIAFEYDDDSLLKKAGNLALSRNGQNGLLTATALGNVTDSLDYNSFGELTTYSASHSGSEIFKTLFTYDKLGRITTKTETVAGTTATFDYGYDLAGHLREVKKDGTVTATYTYDSNGNRLTAPGLSTSPTYDDQDRLTQYGGTTYSYTANGELKTKTVGALVTSYDYDVLGNLKHVTMPDGTTIDYVVDGQNRRIGKKVNGVLVQGSLYEDDLKPIAELDGANNVVSRFVYASRVNVPDYMIKGGVTYRIITDHLGSPRLVVNVMTGQTEQRMEYDAFGNVTTDSNPGFQPFGFAGGLYDPDTNLVRFGARDFDAETARWTEKDPIRFQSEDPNLYAYVSGDPISLSDPHGLGGSRPPVLPMPGVRRPGYVPPRRPVHLKPPATIPPVIRRPLPESPLEPNPASSAGFCGVEESIGKLQKIFPEMFPPAPGPCDTGPCIGPAPRDYSL